jgi:hypothetical protein
MYSNALRDLARMHVAASERRVARQKELICELALAGRSTDLAEELLSTFESALTNQRRHLAHIEAALD